MGARCRRIAPDSASVRADAWQSVQHCFENTVSDTVLTVAVPPSTGWWAINYEVAPQYGERWFTALRKYSCDGECIEAPVNGRHHSPLCLPLQSSPQAIRVAKISDQIKREAGALRTEERTGWLLVLCLLNNLWLGAALSAHISERLRGFCASTRPANAPRPL